MEYILSVVIPCYNCEKTLEKAVSSVLCQPAADKIEIILVDDGAKDSTPQLCDILAEKHGNVRVIHQENGGEGPARNRGIDAATGKYLAVLDSDDWWSPHVFDSAMFEMIDAEDKDVYGFSLRYISPELKNGNIKKCPVEPEKAIGFGKLQYPQMMQVMLCYRLDMLNANNIRYPKLKTMPDIPFVKSAISVACSYKMIDKVLYNYYINPNSFYKGMDDATIFKSEVEGNKIVDDWAERQGLDIKHDPRATVSGIIKFLPRYCAVHSYAETLDWMKDPLFSVTENPEILPWKRYQKSYALWNNNKKLFWLKNKILWYIPCKLKESRTKKPFVKLKNFVWYRLIKKIY